MFVCMYGQPGVKQHRPTLLSHALQYFHESEKARHPASSRRNGHSNDEYHDGCANDGVHGHPGYAEDATPRLRAPASTPGDARI